jgi:hypothetical protein
MYNFVILIGGPGLFKGCDKAHDQNWANYIVPLQLAAQRNLYNKQADELVHWVLYEPPYRNRWIDDSLITKEESQQIDGYHLHSIRKRATDKILEKGSSSYIDRIKNIADTNRIRYAGIGKPYEFWSYLRSLSNESITRVWYSGHAAKAGLMLTLSHNDACLARTPVKYMVRVSDISKQPDLISKFHTRIKRESKFYGCYTESFAKEWNLVFGLSASGAKNKIDFGVIDRPSNILNIMERIEKTPTSAGNPDWTVYK